MKVVDSPEYLQRRIAFAGNSSPTQNREKNLWTKFWQFQTTIQKKKMEVERVISMIYWSSYTTVAILIILMRLPVHIVLVHIKVSILDNIPVFPCAIMVVLLKVIFFVRFNILVQKSKYNALRSVFLVRSRINPRPVKKQKINI